MSQQTEGVSYEDICHLPIDVLQCQMAGLGLPSNPMVTRQRMRQNSF